MILFSEYLTRIGCAFVMGTFIGVERQIRQRNAGLRTNILVSIGAAAFTILSYSMTTGNGDPSRVAAQIVSGIGFLGGGLILKDGLTVRGLNTAATIWCSAACGTLSGVGLYKEAAQGRRITFLYDNQRYFLEKYYLYSQKKHEYLDYIEQYPRSAS